MEYSHDVGSRPQFALRFDNVIPISKLYEIKEETLYDILAIVIYVDEIKVNFKPEGTTASPVITRSLFVLDQSEHWVQVTLWEKQAYELKVQEGEILALRHVKVSGYRGRTISVLSNSTVHMHPHEALPLQCEALARWYKQLGSPRGLDDFTGQTRIVDIDKLQKVPVRVPEDYENTRD
ncbi:hypothetical protein D9756_001183 [Leucocoprinus leucothites]|uniref:Replication protein A OB domain-containing protein n=1 Tax=Leucocoprinus leucothites TaxID=201217 RepID=A0A8H5G426_9AGAR|nr:hypothetical protein D9756_001183 [Leucoagaricus leucothites]